MKFDHGNISVYIPKKSKNFLRICMIYAEEELEITSFSSFIILCIKQFINTLGKEEKSKFEAIAQRLAQKEKPRASEFVDQYIREKKRN